MNEQTKKYVFETNVYSIVMSDNVLYVRVLYCIVFWAVYGHGQYCQFINVC